jgi:hypothetical protein
MPSSVSGRLVLGIVGLILLGPLVPGQASADRGAFPEDRLRYHEDAQNAIAAWNGREEVLLLTTDLRADGNGKLLELLPLPSVPTSITMGDKKQFSDFVEMFNAKVKAVDALKAPKARARSGEDDSVQVLFQRSLRAHNITVARVLDLDHFTAWVYKLAVEGGLKKYVVTDEMRAGIRDHLARGINVFVFDIVEVGPEPASQDPVIYRFKTDRLYYPMAITAASYGNNLGRYPTVNLFMLVDGSIAADGARFFALERGRGFNESLRFNQSEIGAVSPEMRSLFRDGARAARLYSTGGYFEKDNWKRFEDVSIPRYRVEWLHPAEKYGPSSSKAEAPEGAFLTGFLPTLLLCVVGITVAYRVKRHWPAGGVTPAGAPRPSCRRPCSMRATGRTGSASPLVHSYPRPPVHSPLRRGPPRGASRGKGPPRPRSLL